MISISRTVAVTRAAKLALACADVATRQASAQRKMMRRSPQTHCQERRDEPVGGHYVLRVRQPHARHLEGDLWRCAQQCVLFLACDTRALRVVRTLCGRA